MTVTTPTRPSSAYVTAVVSQYESVGTVEKAYRGIYCGSATAAREVAVSVEDDKYVVHAAAEQQEQDDLDRREVEAQAARAGKNQAHSEAENDDDHDYEAQQRVRRRGGVAVRVRGRLGVAY
jgi:hypothetical protein